MKPGTVLIAAFAGFAVLAFAGRNQLKSAIISTAEALRNRNVQAFLAMIRKFESGGQYNILYGGGHFADYSKHPNVRVPFSDPKTGKPNISTAAGAYQITNPTYTMLGGGDFSPASQDAMAIALLKFNGALAYIVAGDFNNAIQLASKTWASLPFTDSMQAHKTVQQAAAEYSKAGGVFA